MVIADSMSIVATPDFDDIDITENLPMNETCKPPSLGESIGVPLSPQEGSFRHWHEGEIIASFLAFDAASRQKQTSTRVYLTRFAVGCYAKFAKKLLK
jgi:hypothetical protein